MIVVTGGAGFIGGHIVRDLVNKGAEPVVVLDNLSGGYKTNVPSSVHLYTVDLRNSTETERLILRLKPRVIYHLAADAAENRSFYTPRYAVENNVNAFLNVVVPAIKTRVQKIIFTSSLSVYGDQSPPFTEYMNPKPVDVYGISKRTVEQLLHTMASFYGFRYTILRLHNVYGIGQNMQDPYRNAVAIFINSILRKRPIYIYGNGKQVRSFTYIKDCVAQLIRASTTKKCENKIYNLGNESRNTVLYVAKTLCRILDYSPTNIQFVPKRKGEVSSAYCDNTLLKQTLSYTDQYTLEEGLKETALHYINAQPLTPRYIKSMELTHTQLPNTWKNHLI